MTDQDDTKTVAVVQFEIESDTRPVDVLAEVHDSIVSTKRDAEKLADENGSEVAEEYEEALIDRQDAFNGAIENLKGN